jgi:hypothetical protein
LSGRSGRGLPDVAANADPATGYQVLIDRQAVVVGGTSAVASLWAALACRMAQATGQPLGMVHPRWYEGAIAFGTDYGFRSITSGNNGAYSAGPGWDACTGLGSPQGVALLNELIYAGEAPTTRLYEDEGPAQGAEEDLTPEFDEFPEAHPVPPESLPVPSERPEPRWILAQAFEAAYPTRAVRRAFRAATEHLVAVQIGPEREDMLTATGGPPIDQVLPPEPGQHDLVIVFIPTGGEVQSRAVVLPNAGPSQVRTFHFATGPGGQHIELQIVVLHRGRVLQSAILRGLVLADPSNAGPESAVELTLAVLRPGLSDLDSREQFDTAVIVAHTPEGKPTAVGIHEEKVSRFDNHGIGRAAEKITTILTDLADNPDDYEPPLERELNVALLRTLAHQGVELYDAMGQHVVEELADENLNAIQVVVSDPNDFIPVELVYDLSPPTLGAGLCANWRQALRDGHCSPEHHPADPADQDLSMVVCPLGFWALSKVIERQVTGRGQPMIDLRGMDFAIRSEPAAGRMHLGRLTAALFAASQRVDKVKPGLTDQVLSTLSGLTGDRASRVYTWAEWVQEVKGLNPPLLVLLPHTEKVQSSLALEIGSREFRVLSQITSSLVKVSPDAAPVVLLLGCDTAVADREYQSFAARFREKGAALVVGTIAAVLGEHAAPVAQAIATALHDAAAGDEVTFGVIMRDIRRKLLAEGELMSLCLATFGDADWRLRVG